MVAGPSGSGGRATALRARIVIPLLLALMVVSRAGWAQEVVREDVDVHASGQRSAASAAFDAGYYHLTLDVQFDPNRIVGRTLVQGRVASGALDTLVLDLHSVMHVRRVETPAGDALPFVHDQHALRIDLPGAPTAPAEVAVVVYYDGPPDDSGDRAFQMGTGPDGSRYAWTLSEPYGARQWWPSKDHPSDKADSIRVTITVPEPLTAVSNGLQIAPPASAAGRVTYDWFSRYPIATYLVSIAAGVYEHHRQTYVRPDSLEAAFGPLELPVDHFEYVDDVSFFHGVNAITGWKHVLRMFPVFEHWFGPYPFAEEKYGHAQFTWGGGMEHQTISSMGGHSVGLVAHELAHQWYGDLITLQSWPHLWLNEGFATYAELLYYEADGDFYGNEPFEQVFNVEYSRALRAVGTLVVQDTSSFNTLFDANRVYAKGAIVLHMLRNVVGDPAFHAILRAYAAAPQHRYGTATTADFQAIAEAVSGQDLGAFFRQWVTDGTGEPVYRVRWSYSPAETGFDVVVGLEQIQSMNAENAWDRSNVEVFIMPVTFEVRGVKSTHRETVWNDQRVQEFRFSVPFEPIDLAFDPERHILRRADVQLVDVAEQPIPPEKLRVAAVFPNPASDELHVQLEGSARAEATLSLFDSLGRRVWRRTLGNTAALLSIDVRPLAGGLYFLRLDADGTSNVKPVVVAR